MTTTAKRGSTTVRLYSVDTGKILGSRGLRYIRQSCSMDQGGKLSHLDHCPTPDIGWDTPIHCSDELLNRWIDCVASTVRRIVILKFYFLNFKLDRPSGKGISLFPRIRKGRDGMNLKRLNESCEPWTLNFFKSTQFLSAWIIVVWVTFSLQLE